MMRLEAWLAMGLLCSAPLGRQVQEVSEDAAVNDWTVLIYGAVDNDWERPFMGDVRAMRKGLEGVEDVEVLLLIDRAPRYSRDDEALGEDFEDTRLYRLTGGAAERLAGEPQLPGLTLDSTLELNMGAASTLRDFIRFAKQQYPARHYALWLVSHGEGPTSCPDETDDDQLYTAELTDVLEERDSVDIIGFDACLMAGVENGYQWRPGEGKFGADFLLAAAPLSSSWPYEEIFAGLRPRGAAAEAVATPAAAPAEEPGLDAEALSAHVVEALRSQIEGGRSGERGLGLDLQSWGSFDLRAVADAKQHLDALARQLWRDGVKDEVMELRGSGLEASTFVYVWPERNSELHMPYVDLAHICERIAAHPELTDETRALAASAALAADAAVAHSFGMDHYEGFEAGRHGLYLIFPEGDTLTRRGATYWQRTGWYSPLAQEGESEDSGRYAWCIDGAKPANHEVENWFELMDAWFDQPTEDSPGGANGYVW